MQAAGRDVLILFGSQTGVALGAARRLQTELRDAGIPVTLACLNQYEAHLSATPPSPPLVVIVSSSFLAGGAPDNATRFRALLDDTAGLRALVDGLPYAVLGIGHSSWPDFCRFTKDIDAALAAAGALPVLARLDADSADVERREAQIGDWIEELRDRVVPLLAAACGGAGAPVDIEETGPAPLCRPEQCCELRDDDDRDRFEAARRLHGRAVHGAVLVHSAFLSGRVLHLELAVPDACLFEPGDCVAIPCANPPGVVRALLAVLGMDPQMSVTVPFVDGKCTLSWALTYCLDLCAAPSAAVLAAAGRVGIGARNALDLYGRCPWLRPSPDVLVQQLAPLAPRYYSIASSPSMHRGRIHLTVAVLADQEARRGPSCRPRRGLCTAYLEACHERRGAGLGSVILPLYVRSDRQLRLPCLERPRSHALVMIGCGVGIAPFRSFLQHIPEGSVKAYLFFGFRDDRDEYLYRDEWRSSASIEFIEVAFSRSESARFRYVQDAIKARAADVVDLIESGAVFYVCGSLAMAAGVYECFVADVLGVAGGLSRSEAIKMMEQQIVHGRYMVEAWE